jgi:hypothetical protein
MVDVRAQLVITMITYRIGSSRVSCSQYEHPPILAGLATSDLPHNIYDKHPSWVACLMSTSSVTVGAVFLYRR